MTETGRAPGSFRDPSGSVFTASGRIFRGIAEAARNEVTDFLDSSYYRDRAGKSIIGTRRVDAQTVIDAGLAAEDVGRFPFWLEHDPIAFISYPYEWSFELLQQAALLHLRLHIDALIAGYDLKDATAYNIQFRGCEPVFIDTLSFQKYRENSHWVGYKQFCEQFLAPLALNAYGKVNFNTWYRGSLDGIDLVSASRLLPARTLLSLNLLTNIHLHAWAMAGVSATRRAAARTASGLPKHNYLHLLESLQRFVAGLKPHTETYWAQYKNDSSYSDAGARCKERLVVDFLQSHHVRRLLDLGCNTGHYSEKAIEAGVQEVIGTDFDAGALNIAARIASRKRLRITPILLDICNPSPDIGWNLSERTSLIGRLQGIDASISLAVVHHIVIGRNIPLEDYVDLLLSLAPLGLAEFVPKSDPMVQGLLAHRQDVFPGYTQENFVRLISRRAKVTAIHAIENSDRVLVAFART